MRRGLAMAMVLVACGPPPAPEDDFARCQQGECAPAFGDGIQNVDLLLVIDDASSMMPAQQALAAALPPFLDALSAGNRSLHVGVIDGDIGVGNVDGIAHCAVGFGHDGLLLTQLANPPSGCAPTYDTFSTHVFDFEAGESTLPTLISDVDCMVQLGTNGCGFQAPLEGALKALSLAPSADGESPVPWTHAGYSPPVFEANTFGHGDDPSTNGAFLRPSSVLVVLILSDEDDCSPTDPTIFSLDDPRYSSVSLPLRCHTFADQLRPLQRYADGFIGLRADPSTLVFGAITGVPTGLGGADPALILADPRMTPSLDPVMPDRLMSVCAAGEAAASPAVRITDLTRYLDAAGARTSVESVCSGDDAPALARIESLVESAAAGGCFDGQSRVAPDGTLGCRLFATGIDCADVVPPLGIEHVTSTGFHACELPQIPLASAGTEHGWTYHPTMDATSPCRSRISLEGISVAGASELLMLCD